MRMNLFFFLVSFFLAASTHAKGGSVFRDLYEKTRKARTVIEYISSLDLPKDQYDLALEMIKEPSLKNATVAQMGFYENTNTLTFIQADQKMILTLASQHPFILSFNGKAIAFEKNDSFSIIRQRIEGAFNEGLKPTQKSSFLLKLSLDMAYAQFGGAGYSGFKFTPAMMVMFFGAAAFSMYNYNKMQQADKAIYEEKMEDKRIKKLTRESDRELSTIQSNLGSGTEIVRLDCNEDSLKKLEFALPDGDRMIYDFSSDKLSAATLKNTKGECKFKSLSGRLTGPPCNLGKSFSNVSDLPGESLFKNISTCCKNEVCRPTLYGNIQVIKDQRSGSTSASGSAAPTRSLRPAVTH